MWKDNCKNLARSLVYVDMDAELYDLAKKVGQNLKEKKFFITTAESCTGGLLAKTLTDVAGSSAYFDRGFITYSNSAKQEILGVKPKVLEEFGAVSEPVAKEMAEGALKNSHAHISIAITGIAGPDGGTKDKPVGTVCIAWARLGSLTKTATINLKGDRASVRMQSVVYVLQWLLSF